jgi:RNA:NAD 2'-phosphotransferase (TPT1/KptA family)/8-oxo-dGTP pyrophosphatase MutT (NUDIX family)
MEELPWTIQFSGFILIDPTCSKVLMVRSRERQIWKFPEGIRDWKKDGSSLYECARRELEEQTGIFPFHYLYCPEPEECSNVSYYYAWIYEKLPRFPRSTAPHVAWMSVQDLAAEFHSNTIEWDRYSLALNALSDPELPMRATCLDTLSSPKRSTWISTKMAFLLRWRLPRFHNLRTDGYVCKWELLEKMHWDDITEKEDAQWYPVLLPFTITMAEIDRAVTTCPKQRFHLSGNWIRANQGHSADVNGLIDDFQLYEPVTDVPTPCIYGTSKKKARVIRKTGLHSGRRSCIHFTSTTTSTALVYVDVSAAKKAGITFFRSANNVIVSKGIDGRIPPELLTIEYRPSVVEETVSTFF